MALKASSQQSRDRVFPKCLSHYQCRYPEPFHNPSGPIWPFRYMVSYVVVAGTGNVTVPRNLNSRRCDGLKREPRHMALLSGRQSLNDTRFDDSHCVGRISFV